MKNPNLYEINTRIWLRRFDTEGKRATLNDVPDEYWQELQDAGIHYLWLMGVWKVNKENLSRYCMTPERTRNYDQALDDWSTKDLIGSPFAIDSYTVNPDIGAEQDIVRLREKLHYYDMKLILDFIPNHFGADSHLIKKKPGIFLSASEDAYLNDPDTFYKPVPELQTAFAHGRDPFFPAWDDTIQLNYFNPATREFMIEQLITIADLCDGVRCDLAMLQLNNVFNNTWRGVVDRNRYPKPDEEFWETAIKALKSKRPEFLFIGEAYWDLEWKLQRYGFDYTYDKRLYDRVKDGTIRSIKEHLGAELSFQEKCVRFVENHDEPRATHTFGVEKSMAAAIIMATTPGMKLYFDGQWCGRKIKLPVQLGREPVEKCNQAIKDFYDKLLRVTADPIFSEGEWRQLEENIDLPGRHHGEILAWEVTANGDRRIVVVNIKDYAMKGSIRVKVSDDNKMITLKDVFHNKTYQRKSEEILKQGLYIDLGPYQWHILRVEE